MATIDTFTKTSAGFTGTIHTVGLKAKVATTPVEKRGDSAPDYRVFVGKVEIRAGWASTSKGGREFVSVKLEDLSELPRNLRHIGMRIALQRVQRLGPVTVATSIGDSPFSKSLDVASWRRSCRRRSLRPNLSRAGTTAAEQSQTRRMEEVEHHPHPLIPPEGEGRSTALRAMGTPPPPSDPSP